MGQVLVFFPWRTGQDTDTTQTISIRLTFLRTCWGWPHRVLHFGTGSYSPF